MKETALQQLIRLINENKCHPHTETEKLLALKWCYDLAVSLLPTERQLVEDAYSEGYATAMYEAETIRRTTSTQYFTETYKTD